MREQLEKLPREEQDKVLEEIHKALLWRGHDEHDIIRGRGQRSLESVQRIAQIFLDNGIEFPEYS